MGAFRCMACKICALTASANTTKAHQIPQRHIRPGPILQLTGPQLEEEIYQTNGCRTGECRTTRAHKLPCKRIIHTVGVRTRSEICHAQESGLHCFYFYRTAMELALENKVVSLAVSCVYTERKGYPGREAAHMAIRTVPLVRRFLDQFSAASSSSFPLPIVAATARPRPTSRMYCVSSTMPRI